MMKKTIFLIFFLGLLIFPAISMADGTYSAKILNQEYTITYDGLVPCGKNVGVNGSNFKDKFAGTDVCPQPDSCEMPCTFCHLFVMIDAVIDFIVGLVFIIAALMIVLSGAMFVVAYLFSPDNPSLIGTAKKTASSVAIGLIICLGAWVFVNTFFIFIGVAETDFGASVKDWSQINCDILVADPDT